MNFSRRISSLSESVTLRVSALAKRMKQEGIDVVGFGAGEPDFDTPSHIKEAAKEAIDAGFTKYTPAGGTKELKKAICEKFKKDNGLDYGEDEIVVSCGAKHCLFNVILAICDDGDEVILPSPYWVSYPEMIKAAGAKAVILETKKENGFKITKENLSKSISKKTKLFILNSPSNPTGAVYSEGELKGIAEVIVSSGIMCISDEIYEKIIYEGKHTSIASLNDTIKKHTIVINGVSKAYAMTGWRIGYAAANRDIIKTVSNLQSHSTSNPASVSQKAALSALSGSQECIQKMVEEFKRRRDFIVKRINSIRGLSCLKPQGAFYVFVSIGELLGKRFSGKPLDDALSFSQCLLENAHVAVVPGEAFGRKDYIRLSYASSMENIKKGLDRIEAFVKKLG